MRQAIVTKYLGPTDFKGARIKATAAGGSLTVPYDHSLDAPRNHMEAARQFVIRLGWTAARGSGHVGLWVGGVLPDERSNVYVFTSEGDQPSGWPPGTAFEITAES